MIPIRACNSAQNWITLIGLLAMLSASGAVFGQPALGGMSRVTVSSSLRPEFHVTPGETRSGLVTVRNDGDEATTVEISQVDFDLDPTGQVRYLGDAQPRSNRSWVQIANQATVPARGSVDIPFTVVVPSDASLHGTYWSMILVEPVDQATFTDEAEDDAGIRTSVTVAFRYGVVVLAHVGEPDEQELRFTDPEFTGEEGAYRLDVRVDNPGAFLVAADLWLELYDEQGDLTQRLEGERLRLYPGSSLLRSFHLGALEPQRYQAVIIGDAGGDDVFGVRYTLPVTAGSSAPD